MIFKYAKIITNQILNIMTNTIPYTGPVIPDFDKLKNKDVVKFITTLSTYISNRKKNGIMDDTLTTVLNDNLARVNSLSPGYIRRLFRKWIDPFSPILEHIPKEILRKHNHIFYNVLTRIGYRKQQIVSTYINSTDSELVSYIINIADACNSPYVTDKVVAVQACIDAGAVINAEYSGKTPLQHMIEYCIKYNNQFNAFDALELLIHSGADIKKYINGLPPLLYVYSIIFNNTIDYDPLVKILLKFGIQDINKSTTDGTTLVMYMAKYVRDKDIFISIIDAGADITAIDISGKSILSYANLNMYCFDIMDILFNKDALNITTTRDVLIDLIINIPANLYGVAIPSYLNNNYHLVELYLNSKIDPNMQDDKGMTALMHVSRLYAYGRNNPLFIEHAKKLISLLIKYNADPHICDNMGFSASHHIAMYSIVALNRYTFYEDNAELIYNMNKQLFDAEKLRANSCGDSHMGERLCAIANLHEHVKSNIISFKWA